MKHSEDTKSNIQQAARALFGQKGYAGTSMSEIANQTGITKASLYYFFKSKETLYLSLIERVMKHIENQLKDVLNNYPSQPLTEVLDQLMKTAIENNLFVPGPDPTALGSPKTHAHLHKKKRNIDNLMITMLRKYKVGDPELATHSLMHAMHGYVKECACGSPSVERKQYAEHLASLYTQPNKR